MLTAHLPSGYVLARAFPRDVRWLVFFAAILLHLCLDTIGGGIMWAAPFNDHLYPLVTVPPTQSHWIASFILHWIFLLELIIWSVVIVMWRKRQGS